MTGSAAAPSTQARVVTRRAPRAIRGLIGIFLLTCLNLLGSFLLLTAIGGIEPWSGWQFVGLFGFVEMATGLAFLVAPNAWRLPVEAAADDSARRVELSPRRLLLPRWGALAKVAAGLALLGAAATRTGIGAGAALIPVVALAVAIAILSLSLAAARWGVARPDLDVYQLIVRRPGGREITLPGVSLSSMVVQFVLNITVIPVVKLTPPAIFYDPELGPSPAIAVTTLVASIMTGALALLAWRGHLRWAAPAEPLPEEEAAVR